MALKKQSRLLLLFELLLDGVLLLLFIPQVLILGCHLVYGYVPIPSNWLNEQLSKVEVSGFRIQAEQCQLYLNGRIALHDIEIFAADNEEAIFEAENAYIHYTLFNKNRPIVDVSELILTSGTAYLPPVYAPSGERSPLLERVAFDLTIEEDHLHLESFCATLEDIRLRGSAHYPHGVKADTDSQAPSPGDDDDWLANTYKLIADGIAVRHEYHFFKSPTLVFDLNVVNPSLIELETEVVSPLFQHDEASAAEVIIELSTLIEDGAIQFSEPTLIRAKSLQTHNYDLSTGPISARITKDDWSQIMESRWPEVELSAENLNAAGVQMETPYLKLWHEEGEGLGFLGATKGMLGGVEFSGVFNLHERSGWLDAGGSVSIYKLLPDSIKGKLPKLDFSSAPYYNIFLTLDPEMQLDRIDFDCLINDVAADEIDFEQIRARGYYAEDEFVLSQLDIQRSTQSLEASIRYRQKDGALDALLKGVVNPKDYNPLLPNWWASVFEDFDFTHPDYKVDADFIIRANTKQGCVNDYYGSVLLSNIQYSKVPIDDGHIIVRGTPRYIEVHIINGTGSDGSLDGAIGFTVLPDDCPGPSAIHFDVATHLHEGALENIMGDVLYDRTIGDLHFSVPPSAQLRGVYFDEDHYPQYIGKSHYIFSAISNGPVRWDDTPLDFLNVSGYADGTITQLRNVLFGYANGHGSAALDAIGQAGEPPLICLQANLQDADEQRAISNLPALDAIEDSLKDQNDESLDPLTREDGRIFANAHALWPLDDFYAITGYGSIAIQDKELGSIQLLGPLSKILQGTSLGFTSFSLDRLESDFELTDRQVIFPRVEINGQRTRIEATGSMQMEDQTLDMRVTVRLFGNVGSSANPIRQLSNIVNPLAFLLKFHVTGTLEKQKFRSVYDPRELLPF